MDIPRFNNFSIAPEKKKTGTGESFQDFICDLFSAKYSNMTQFNTKGKDGAIDHAIQFLDGKGFIECKDIQDGYESAMRNWKQVADKLSRNITPPDGPPKGQRQYLPWYNRRSPIRSYFFCISSELANENQIQELEKIISDFFSRMSAQCIHLKHLADIEVRCMPWNRIVPALKRNRAIAFKWFPACRPIGLVPLKTQKVELLNFRSYLDYHQLPFFSPEEFIRIDNKQQNSKFFSLTQLFEELKTRKYNGLIFTGKGGIGKTRLVMEAGHYFLRNNGLVFQAGNRTNVDSIDSLCQRIETVDPVLILFDYVESQREFTNIIDAINDYNGQYGYRIQYVANCRTNYYANIQEQEGHKELNLSPGGKDATLFHAYRKATVLHILHHSGPTSPEKFVHICQDLPILAVFICFLKQSGREVDLEQLRSETSFISWINKRMNVSFSLLYPGNSQGMRQDLSRLLVQYPLTETGIITLEEQEPSLFQLHNSLVTDGWVLEDEKKQWVSAHDIFVDQILSDFFQHSQQARSDIRRSLDLSCRLSNLNSALIGYQRIADIFSEDMWFSIINDQIYRHQEQWIIIRDMLLSTSLLTAGQRIQLLRINTDFWAGAEQDYRVQNALGYLAQMQVKGKIRLSNSLLFTLKEWLEKAAVQHRRNSFLIGWSLRLFPDRFKAWVLDDLKSRKIIYHRQYLLVSWLDVGLPPKDVEDLVISWCDSFFSLPNFSFIAKAWLNANGDKESIKQHISAWLNTKNNRISPEAQFVYRAWLDAGGELDIVKDTISDWMEFRENSISSVAPFVYKGWLDAGGNKNLVKKFFVEWLNAENNRISLEAQFVYKSWLDAGGNRNLVKRYIVEWLNVENNRISLEAPFIYQAWLDAGGELDIVKNAVSDWMDFEDNSSNPVAPFVYKSWLDARGNRNLVKKFIVKWLHLENNKISMEARFVYKGWLDAGGNKNLVKEFIVEWLNWKNNKISMEAPFVYRAWLNVGGELEIVKKAISAWMEFEDNSTAPVAQFVYKSWLDAGGNKNLIEKFIVEWLNQEDNRVSLDAQFVYNAWLNAGGQLEIVKEAVSAWIEFEDNSTNSVAQFLYKAWLDAGGNKNLVKEFIVKWLDVKNNGISLNARFVYKAWLDAGGNKDLVKKFIVKWLDAKDNKISLKASFVYQGWLNAGGNFALLKEPVGCWLAVNKQKYDAFYIMNCLVQIQDLPDEIIHDILDWCRFFHRKEDGIFLLSKLKGKLRYKQFAVKELETFGLILPHVLLREKFNFPLKMHVMTTFVNLAYNPVLRKEPYKRILVKLFTGWIKDPRSTFNSQPPNKFLFMQTQYLFQLFIDAFNMNYLDKHHDLKSAKAFLVWVDSWRPEKKEKIKNIYRDFIKSQPLDELWNVINFN